MPDRTLRIFKPANPAAALGLAVSHLMIKPAFANLKFGDWSRILVGQINRGHYCFAVDADNQVQGFMGWALATKEQGRGLGRGPPRLSASRTARTATAWSSMRGRRIRHGSRASCSRRRAASAATRPRSISSATTRTAPRGRRASRSTPSSVAYRAAGADAHAYSRAQISSPHSDRRRGARIRVRARRAIDPRRLRCMKYHAIV